VCYQSPESIVCHGQEEVALYCVVNILSIQTHYKWHAPDSCAFPSTPVIYVTKPGMYFCTVQYSDFEVRSRPSEVSVLPGTHLALLLFFLQLFFASGETSVVRNISVSSVLSNSSNNSGLWYNEPSGSPPCGSPPSGSLGVSCNMK
jgi:hypothetical protein